jgi:transaldolase/glucose-6-phosphate isomerase
MITMNPLLKLAERGQAVWLDYIRRQLLTSGELARLVREDGLRGVTSNPTIFEKAISGSTDYDADLRASLARDPRIPVMELYETLAIADIQMAADVLRPVFDQTGGGDGYVSLEVSPHLARDQEGTIAEAQRLWRAVSRPNLMIKVPATPAGIPAIEALIAAGININVTLMFSLSHYEAVARAHIRGLSRCRRPEQVHSVASFFVSRMDTVIDRILEKMGTPEALALLGKVAVANSACVYRRFREIFHGEDFAALRPQGANVQRPLWASTGTKNPAYSDVIYIEELVGPETVNTIPPATMDAFRAHGQVRGDTILEGEPDAVFARLAGLGVDVYAAAEKLQEDGVAAFSASFDQLLAALEEKRRVIFAAQISHQDFSLGSRRRQVEERLTGWQKTGLASRLWRKDPAIWSADPAVPELTDRLGWLALATSVSGEAGELKAFAEEIRGEGFRHVVLLGMGGSSLAPEVFQRTFGNASGYPELVVLDSTHPGSVRAVENRIDPQRTLFLVSSKSGTTTEPLSFFHYFWERAGKQGRRFIAITDPGTPLAHMAQQRGFRRVFEAPADVGGRYSALTVFGLLPAALIGVDIQRVLDLAWQMTEACAVGSTLSANPGLSLGAALGELAVAGRDKVTFVSSPSLVSLPDWIEQLIAESTGKDDKGIVPIAGEPLGQPGIYGNDRVFVDLCLRGEEDAGVTARIDALQAAGHPVIRIKLEEKAFLGAEFFRWEIATAAAGAVLGVHPFNQPDVQLAKELARKAMQDSGAGAAAADDLIPAAANLASALKAWLGEARPGDYIALQAYLAPALETMVALENIRFVLRDHLRLATTVGYGPRFLHSTGQLHKGGPNTGLFLQLVDDASGDLAVPESAYSFGALVRAQATGDADALRRRGRRLLRLSLGADPAAGLRNLEAVLRHEFGGRKGKANP